MAGGITILRHFLDMTIIFLFSQAFCSSLISKSKEMETILDLSTIKLEELFEDTIFTQCNHTPFCFGQMSENYLSKLNALSSPKLISVHSSISYLLSSIIHVIFSMKTGMHSLQLNDTPSSFLQQDLLKIH